MNDLLQLPGTTMTGKLSPVISDIENDTSNIDSVSNITDDDCASACIKIS